jgi:addiction module RelE/StbE family toxin
MVRRVIWAANAQFDRKEILNYWNNRNKSNAYSKKLNELFVKALSIIKKHPNIGMQTSFKNVRIKVVKDYYLIYEYNESEIAVLAIWDTNQNPDNQKIKPL